ncbi:hypothetical protein FGB62_38g22 [Gracilaria domingensis]|nr:hypothetical protein FGB62_38g22 [Gracilaria domingensis]
MSAAKAEVAVCGERGLCVMDSGHALACDGLHHGARQLLFLDAQSDSAFSMKRIWIEGASETGGEAEWKQLSVGELKQSLCRRIDISQDGTRRILSDLNAVSEFGAVDPLAIGGSTPPDFDAFAGSSGTRSGCYAHHLPPPFPWQGVALYSRPHCSECGATCRPSISVENIN